MIVWLNWVKLVLPLISSNCPQSLACIVFLFHTFIVLVTGHNFKGKECELIRTLLNLFSFIVFWVSILITTSFGPVCSILICFCQIMHLCIRFQSLLTSFCHRCTLQIALRDSVKNKQSSAILSKTKKVLHTYLLFVPIKVTIDK